jgi:hypothetical protein
LKSYDYQTLQKAVKIKGKEWPDVKIVLNLRSLYSKLIDHDYLRTDELNKFLNDVCGFIRIELSKFTRETRKISDDEEEIVENGISGQLI